MEFIKILVKNRKLIFQLGKNDFKNRFANTSLGSVWGFLQPFIFMITYVIVFQYILKTGSAGNYPYLVWFLPGMSMWMSLNDMIISASNSVRTYSYLVKKVVFPVDIIPLISITASSVVAIFLFIISIFTCIAFGFFPNVLMLIYMFICLYALVISITRITSALTTLVPDFGQLLNIAMQLFFWFTPIIWNLSMLEEYPLLQRIFKSMPFTYLVTGFRQVFTSDGCVISEYGYKITIIFWLFVVMMFIWGNHVFKKGKKDFADVL